MVRISVMFEFAGCILRGCRQRTGREKILRNNTKKNFFVVVISNMERKI